MIRRRKKVLAAIASEKLLIRASEPEGSTNMGNVDTECWGRSEKGCAATDNTSPQ